MKLHKALKRVLFTLLIVLISFCVLSVSATAIFYHTAFARRDTPSPVAFGDREYPSETVRFLSGNNRLTGYLYRCDAPRALAVIAAGFGESGAAYFSLTQAFVDEGYSVLCYDATGVGESEGGSMIGLSQPALDLRAALAFIAEDGELSRLPVLLFGCSCGGYAAASCLDDDQVAAAAILSGFESPTELMRESARKHVGVLADIEYPFLWLGNTVVFGGEGNDSASACIENAAAPVVIYEGVHDEVIPPSVRLSAFLDTERDHVSLIQCGGDLHSGHADLWLSDEAVKARESESDDPDLLNEPDADFLDGLLAFYRAALSAS